MSNNRGNNLICKFGHSLRTSSNSADYGGLSNICHCILVLLAAAAIILIAAEAGMALNSDDSQDNAGPIVNATDVFSKTGWISFTANELPMFYLDLDEVNFDPDNYQGESLTIHLIEEDQIAEDGVIYTSRAWTDENGRTNIAWLGEKYLALGDNPSKLTKYLVDFKSYESLALEKGEVWDIGEGYTINFTDIDVNGEHVSLVLEKDSSPVHTFFASAGETVYYNTTVVGVSDVTVARIHVDTILADTNVIIIDEVQIISQSVFELNQDQYFGMDFSSAADYIELTKGSTTSISRRSTVGIIPDFLSIRVGDTQLDEPVRFYIFSEITSQELYKQHGSIINSTAEAPDSIILNANELPMFYKDLDEINFDPENNKGESLKINLFDEDEIAAEGINYRSTAWTDANGRMNIAWLGEKYLAVGDDVTKLTKYLVDFNSSENLTLGLGEVWDIGEGYTLNFTDIDVQGNQVILVLENESSSLVYSDIASAGDTVYYKDIVANVSDVTVARIHVDTIFADTNVIIIDEVQIISQSVTELNQDQYFGMDFSSAADYIELTEDDTTSISRGRTFEIIPDFLGIRVGDTQLDEPVRFYVSREGADATPPVPEITIFAPLSPVSDIVGATRTFNITVDQIVNVTWYINGTQIQFNEGIIKAEYINTSAAKGTWNVTAVAQNNNGTDMQEWIWIVTPPPIALITEPEEGAYIRGTIDIIGTASDINFKNYTVEWKNTTGDWIQIQNSTGSVSGGTLATWDTSTLEDGNYMIKLTVTNNASESNITVVNVTIDNTQPTAIISEPEEGEYIHGTIGIIGTANDTNFKNYTVEWKNTTGDWTQIQNSTGSVSGGTLASWDTTDVDDDNYMIKLTVTDNASNSNITIVNVTIDNTQPIAIITEPEEGAYINETIDIIGTASDTNLKNYTVEWKNTTGDWTQIQNLTWSVSGGTLASWDTSTLEDGNYMIKLTVTDNASNSNITIVNVIFDSTRPEVSITEPEQDSLLKFFENFVKGEVSDNNFDSAQLIVKNGTDVIVSFYNLDITDNKFSKRVEFAPNQTNTLELIAFDKANNSNSTNITIIVGNNTYQKTTDVNESEQVVINATYEAGTEIEFYPNVTADSVTFTVTAITDEIQINILNNSIFTVSGEMAVGKIVEINVTGLDATNESEVQSVTLYLHYTKADLDLNGDGTLGPGDLDEDNLFIYWFNSGNWTKLLKANPDWVIDNGQVKISEDDPGQVWVKVKHLSMFALAALPEPQPTYDGGDDSNGGGGGGGGGASGEDYKNIECFEIDRQFVNKDSSVSYNFSNECNTVDHINFTALTTSGTVVGKIEMLKNTSTLVDIAPPNIVFKNFNIWVGYAGWATDQNIEDVTITFVVNKSWVQANNIDTELITLNRYVNSNWIQLLTKQVGERNGLLIFSASTSPDGFGNFAVTGVEIGGEVDVTTTPVVTSVATPSEMPTTEPNQKSTYKTWLILGVVLLLLGLGYLKKDQISIWLKERRP